MKALSVRQPWAQAIMAGAKTIENRTWTTHYRGRVAVHASQARPSVEDLECCADLGYRCPEDAPLGAVLGTIDVVGMLTPEMSHSEALAELKRALGVEPNRDALDWYDDGQFGWILARPQWLARAEPCKGRLHLWDWAPGK